MIYIHCSLLIRKKILHYNLHDMTTIIKQFSKYNKMESYKFQLKVYIGKKKIILSMLHIIQ